MTCWANELLLSNSKWPCSLWWSKPSASFSHAISFLSLSSLCGILELTGGTRRIERLHDMDFVTKFLRHHISHWVPCFWAFGMNSGNGNCNWKLRAFWSIVASRTWDPPHRNQAPDHSTDLTFQCRSYIDHNSMVGRYRSNILFSFSCLQKNKREPIPLQFLQWQSEMWELTRTTAIQMMQSAEIYPGAGEPTKTDRYTDASFRLPKGSRPRGGLVLQKKISLCSP